MDFIKKAVGGSEEGQGQQDQQGSQQGSTQQQSTGGEQKEGGGFFSGIGNKINEAAGGGKESEKNEDYLDKGIDAFQQHVLGQGPQDNESAVEQAKDEQISDFIRGKFKDSTGKDIPIEDKPTRFS
ncbi:hypothetical protein BJ875DRAFT_481259 [Amylocarpus encephaloides]|uniref:DNA damage-responsive protein 48 n=1 Tax=Amylocarpus encephaloides TaxID=45428 RepID=A0A9P7YQF6_9HELO|nr:hypothetical protein BJ875DRAFT_481259 [Amylocarpus encephaloides]